MNTTEISNGVYWVGENGMNKGLNCNPYLIIDNDEGILIDPGNVLDFESVYNNVISLIPLEKVKYVILHHQDPDFCSSVPLFEKAGAKFQIVTHWRASLLIKYYGVKSQFYIINEKKFKLKLSSGRELVFIATPYLHFPGAFATYDYQTKILFSSDLFGAFSYNWSLFADETYIEKMKMFHEHYMPSNDIIRPVMEILLTMDITMIAPQHGSIIKENISVYIKALRDLECGKYLNSIKKEVGKSGGYKSLVSLTLTRLYSIFKKEEVEKAIEGLEISFDKNSFEILDFNYRGIDLWNGIFENILKTMGMNWLVALEPFVNQICNEYDAQIPKIYQSKIIDAQREVRDLNLENEELKKLNEKLSNSINEVHDQMTRCPITGLYNYSFFKKYLSNSMKEVQTERNGMVMSLLIINVDNMANIKYTYGDDEADVTLKKLAYIINKYTENNMVAFRLQGASFGCYFIREAKEKVILFAEALRNEISSSQKFIENITVSIGIVSSDEIMVKDDNWEEIGNQFYKIAVKRVEQAKKSGANMVCSNSVIDDSKKAGYILIADIDSASVDVLKNVMENLNYQVKSAGDGEEILELCMEERPLLIITEMMLPKYDALQVYRKLQMLTATKNIPYLIVSRVKNEDTIKSTYALGINYYLKKPYLMAELVGIIKNVIRGNKLES